MDLSIGFLGFRDAFRIESIPSIIIFRAMNIFEYRLRRPHEVN